MTPSTDVFPVMCPDEETGAGLAPLAGLIRSLSALVGRDPSQSCRPRSHPQTGIGVVPHRLEVFWMLADELDFVVGVDPHRDAHALAVVEVRSGVVVVEASVAANSHGYAEALHVIERHAPGRRAFAVEGTGSFGAGLTRFLTTQ